MLHGFLTDIIPFSLMIRKQILPIHKFKLRDEINSLLLHILVYQCTILLRSRNVSTRWLVFRLALKFESVSCCLRIHHANHLSNIFPYMLGLHINTDTTDSHLFHVVGIEQASFQNDPNRYVPFFFLV